MPVEIRELVIKVNVNQSQQSSGEGNAASAAIPAGGKQQPAEKMVADAVEQVMDLIRNKNER